MKEHLLKLIEQYQGFTSNVVRKEKWAIVEDVFALSGDNDCSINDSKSSSEIPVILDFDD